MKRRFFTIFYVIFLVLCGAFSAHAQNVDAVLKNARSAMDGYRFEEALEMYNAAAQADTARRSEIERAASCARNGIQMRSYVSDPTVIARKRLSDKEFYLYYPLPDKAWKAAPNVLDDAADGGIVGATYSDSDRMIVFSAVSERGDRDIFVTTFNGTEWTICEALSANVNSEGNEIFPMLSPDGKRLYFASDGLYGVGGYDLYVSEWDSRKKEWGRAVNLGFPYSSPANDYLYIETPDGQYAVMSSDRDAQKGYVNVYVLEYEANPIRKEIGTPKELKAISAMKPAGGQAFEEEGTATDDPATDEYYSRLEEVRAISDSIDRQCAVLDKSRLAYSGMKDGAEKDAAGKEILEGEKVIKSLLDARDEAVARFREAEMALWESGVEPVPARPRSQQNTEPSGNDEFVFVRHNLGKMATMTFELPPEPEEE